MSASNWPRMNSGEPLAQGLLVVSGAVAQLGERLICTQEVAGSIPTSSTSMVICSMVICERTPDKGEVGSSTLPRPTKRSDQSSASSFRAGKGREVLAES